MPVYPRMAWSSQRSRRRQPTSLPGRMAVHRKPLVQSNLSVSVSGENVDELLELLSTLNEGEPSNPSSVDESTSAHSRSESVRRRRQFNLDTHLTVARRTWSAKHEMSSHSGGHRTSKCNLTDGDICGPMSVRAGKCREECRQPAERENYCKIPPRSHPPSLASAFPGSASFYPNPHDPLYERQTEPVKEAHSVTHACLKQSEHTSTFQDLLESSWTSASLHRSMLDLEISPGDLQLQAPNTVRSLALSASLASPFDMESHDPVVSCDAKMSCPVFHRQSGDLKRYSARRYSCSSTCMGNGKLQSTTNSQRDISKNVTTESTKFSLPSDAVSITHCEPGWNTERPAEKNLNVLASAMCGPELYSSEEWNLPESLSRKQKRTEVTFPEYGTKWPCEFSTHSKSSPIDSGYGLYPHLDHAKATDTLLELPKVTRYLSWEEILEIKENLGNTDFHLKNSTDQVKRDGYAGAERGSQRRIPVSTSPESHDYPIHETHVLTLASIHVGGSASSEYPVERSVKGRKPSSALHKSVPVPPDATEICRSIPAETIESRFLALYRFRLQLSCFGSWVGRWSSYTRARRQHRKHLLNTGLSALRQVLTHRAHLDILTRSRDALSLAKAFHQWLRRAGEKRRSDADPALRRGGELELESLRRRLTRPSDALVLRTAYGAWRRHVRGVQLRRAALIHYHLTLLCQHWLLWRQAGWRSHTWANQEQRAALRWEARLKTRVYTAWSSTWSTGLQARQHHRASCLAAVWRAWRAKATRRAEARSALANQSAGLHRESLLRRSLRLWRARAEQRRRQRERMHGVVRRAARRWRRLTQGSRLRRACNDAERVLSRQTLAAAFGRWRQRKTAAEAARRQAQRGRHLLARVRAQTAFTRWRAKACARRGSRELLAKRTRAQLADVLRGWRVVVERKTACVCYRRRRDTLAAGRTLGTWASATRRRGLHRHLVTQLLQSRRGAGLQALSRAPLTPRLSGATGTLEAACDHLQLQTNFHIWRTERNKLHLARLYCRARLTALARSALRRWRALAGDGRACEAPGFRAKPAVLDASITSSGIGSTSPLNLSLENSSGSIQQSVQVWSAQGCWHEESKLEVDCSLNIGICERPLLASSPLLDSHKLSSQSDATEESRNVSYHQNQSDHKNTDHKTSRRSEEAVLSTSCLSHWKAAFAQRRAEGAWRGEAEVLRRCFSTWQRKWTWARADPEVRARLESRVSWLRKRGERRRTHAAFALWRARFRQSHAVSAFYTHTTLTRVFVAWKRHVQSYGSMAVRAQARLRQRSLGSALARWRAAAAGALETRRRRDAGLTRLARESLQRWRELTHRKCVLRQLLCGYVETSRRREKKAVLVTWVRETDNAKKAQAGHQHALMSRLIQRWRSNAQRGAEERNSITAAEARRQQRAVRRVFTSWRRRVSHQQGVAQAVVYRWREAALQSKAVSRHTVSLASRLFCRWRRALGRRGEARALARQRGEERARAAAFRQDGGRRELAQVFLYWVTVCRASRRSKDFYRQTLCQRVLLGWHAYAGPSLARRRRGARLQHDRAQGLAARCFARWRAELGRAQHRDQLLGQTLHQRNGRLTRDTVTYWRTATRGSTALRHLHRGRLQQCLDYWRGMGRMSGAARLMCVQRERRDSQQVLLAWSQWARESTGRRRMGEAVWLWLEGRWVTRAFHLWVIVHRRHAEASRLSSANLTRRSFQAWTVFAREKTLPSRTAEAKMRTLRIQSTFDIWRRRAASHQALRDLARRVRDRKRRSLLMSSLHAWHGEVQVCRRRSLHLSEKYFARWAETASARRSQRRGRRESRLRDGLWRWRLGALRRRAQRRHIQVLWDSWTDQTAAVLLFRTLYTDRLQQGAWLTWRKRRIRTRVSQTCAARADRAMVAQVFHEWRRRAFWLSATHGRPVS